MKAVVLARGKGTRMQSAEAGVPLDSAQARMADAGLKAMIPFRRPFLDYVLSALADAACTDVCLVVAPDHEVIREYYTRERPPDRVRLTYAVQAQALGTADAVLAADQFAGADPFLALNSDNYYPPEVFRALAALDGPGLPAFDPAGLLRGNIERGRVAAYAILRIDRDGNLEEIIEKPNPADLAPGTEHTYPISMNCWRFGPFIFEACRRIERSSRGEFEIPSAVRYAIERMDVRFRTVPFSVPVMDLSRRADVGAVERYLERIDPRP